MELQKSPTLVEGDKDMLMQVVINLLSNAVKFAAPSNPAVWVTLTKNDSDATVHVMDNGPGIPKEKQDIIFDRFIQIKGDAKPQGTGLGLTISKRIVQFHSGTIGISDTAENLTAKGESQGADFYFTLPLDLTDNSA